MMIPTMYSWQNLHAPPSATMTISPMITHLSVLYRDSVSVPWGRYSATRSSIGVYQRPGTGLSVTCSSAPFSRRMLACTGLSSGSSST